MSFASEQHFKLKHYHQHDKPNLSILKQHIYLPLGVIFHFSFPFSSVIGLFVKLTSFSFITIYWYMLSMYRLIINLAFVKRTLRLKKPWKLPPQLFYCPYMMLFPDFSIMSNLMSAFVFSGVKLLSHFSWKSLYFVYLWHQQKSCCSFNSSAK